MAGRKKEKARVDLERQVYTRPSAKKTIEPKSREPKRKPLSVQDYDVQTIHPRKSQGQSSQNNVRIRDRSHRQNYDIHDQSEDTNESDEAFAPPASRAGLKTERIYSEKISSPRHPPRHNNDDSRRSSNRDLSIEPPLRSARRDQPRRNQSSGRHRRVRDSSTDSSQSLSPPRRRARSSARCSSTDSSQSRSPPRRRAKGSARNNRDRSRSLDYRSKPEIREYARPIRDSPDYGAGLPRSATFPSQHSKRHTTDASHDFGPSSRSQTFPNLNGQSYNSPFMDPMFPNSGGFQSFSTSYTSPSGYQSYTTTNTFDGSSPFDQNFFSGGSTPRTPRNNAFFTERPRRTSQYESYPQSSPNAYAPPWDGGVMDDILKAGHEFIDRSMENAQRRTQQEKARMAREREPRYDWTRPNHTNHDQTPRYDHKYHDKHTRDHGHDHHTSSSSHPTDYERFHKQRERARSRARSQARHHKHEHEHPRPAPSPVKDDATHDYYATLGILPTATLDEVRAAAKKRRVATHPDKCKKPGMTEAQKMEIDEEAKRVGEAAVNLSDESLRAKYDYEHHMKKRFGGMRM